MNKKECKIIQDLLPNYIDKLTNEETNAYIEEHLNDCEKCQKVLESMKKEITLDETKRERKAVQYLKKYNREVKVLQIILLIILLGFIAVVANKFFILKGLSQKSEEMAKISNFHVIREAYSAGGRVSGNQYSGKCMSIYESYYKDGNHITTITFYLDEGDSRKTILYKNENDEMIYGTSTTDGKTIVNKIYFEGDLSEATTWPAYYGSGNFWQTLYDALFAKIDSVKINGEEYYLIRNKTGDHYVDKENGLVIKSLIVNESVLMDVYCEFNTVKDSDIVKPDITK